MEKITEWKFYCSGCGKLLNVHKINISYDKNTGKEKYLLGWFCSKRKWYGIFSKHDYFETNIHGDEIGYFNEE